MKIHPVFIMTAPIMIMVSCVQYGAGSQLVQPTQPPAQQPAVSPIANTNARTLFLRNCAHCHGADGHGDDGPDLHDIGWTNDQIVGRIQKGKTDQMTAFAGKLKPSEIEMLAAYVQSLK